MKTFRIHLKQGLSQANFDLLLRRLGFLYKDIQPVKGGGRSLIIAIDIQTHDMSCAENFAKKRLWLHGKNTGLRGFGPKARAKADRIEVVE